MTKILPPSEVHEKETQSKDLLEQTVIYKYLVVVGKTQINNQILLLSKKKKKSIFPSVAKSKYARYNV